MIPKGKEKSLRLLVANADLHSGLLYYIAGCVVVRSETRNDIDLKKMAE